MSFWDDLGSGLTSVGRKIPLVGDFISDAEANDDAEARAAAYRQMAEKLYGGMTPPELQVGESAQAGVYADPMAADAQRAALDYLRQSVQQGGLTQQDRAALLSGQRQLSQQERAQRMALQQQARMRGVGTSGDALAQQAIAQQASANRASQMGTDLAAQAQQRALQNVAGMASLGGQMRGQGFQEASSRAQAKDAINRFNSAARGQEFGMGMDLANAKYRANSGATEAEFKVGEDQRARDAGFRGMVTDGLVTAATGGLGGSVMGQSPRDEERRRGGFGVR